MNLRFFNKILSKFSHFYQFLIFLNNILLSFFFFYFSGFTSCSTFHYYILLCICFFFLNILLKALVDKIIFISIFNEIFINNYCNIHLFSNMNCAIIEIIYTIFDIDFFHFIIIHLTYLFTFFLKYL